MPARPACIHATTARGPRACLAAGEKGNRYSLFGAYRYNTFPYTHSWPWSESFHGPRGRLGEAAPVADGTSGEGAEADYGDVARITSLIQCPYFGGHGGRGLNCTYIDGHTVWLATPPSVRDMWLNDGTVRSYGNRLNYARKGLWRWASFMDEGG